MADRALGLIAGQGRLPMLVATGMKAAGARVCGVGLRGHYDADLPALCDDFDVAGVFRLGRWIKTLRRHGVSEAVLVGRVSKARMHDPLRMLRQMPDWRATKVWFRRLRDDRRSAALLAAVADELQDSGITLIDSTTYIADQLAGEGLLTRVGIEPRQQADIDRGWPVLEQVAELDIGQSIAVCHGRILAVESLEGTDAMIERAARLNGGGGWTLLKAPRRDHDMRADVPAVGEVTIERLAAAQAACLALKAGRVIMIDKPRVIAAADRAGIPIVGVGKSGVGG
jgi:DUF1009 family protein